MSDKTRVNVDCGTDRGEKRFLSDGKFFNLLLTIVGFLLSGMLYVSYLQLEKKVDKDQHATDIAAVNQKINDKFDLISGKTDLIIKVLEGKQDARDRRRGE
jgi:hypothetical protein